MLSHVGFYRIMEFYNLFKCVKIRSFCYNRHFEIFKFGPLESYDSSALKDFADWIRFGESKDPFLESKLIERQALAIVS